MRRITGQFECMECLIHPGLVLECSLERGKRVSMAFSSCKFYVYLRQPELRPVRRASDDLGGENLLNGWAKKD